jgi:hypothetical protein
MRGLFGEMEKNRKKKEKKKEKEKLEKNNWV